MTKRDITVIIPTYNHQEYIEDAIASVIKQNTFESCTVIVSDDVSSDRTVAIARAVSRRHSNITVRSNRKNLGIIPHYRTLVEMVETPFVAVLEGDDRWLSPRKLELQRNMLEAFQNIGMCFCAFLVEDTATGARWQQPFWPKSRNRVLQFLDFLDENPVGTFSNCLYRTDRLKRVLKIKTVDRGYDWLLNLLIAMDGGVAYIAEPSTLYRLHPKGTWTQLSAEGKLEAIRETLGELLKLAPNALKPFVNSAIRRVS